MPPPCCVSHCQSVAVKRSWEMSSSSPAVEAAAAAPTPSVVVVEDAIPPELRIDEKESELHRLDSLSLLLYTFLLTLTVLTVWLFKHRRIRYLHETGLAVLYGLVIGECHLPASRCMCCTSTAQLYSTYI